LFFQGLDGFHTDFGLTSVFLGFGFKRFWLTGFIRYRINNSTKIKLIKTVIRIASVKTGKTKAITTVSEMKQIKKNSEN